MEVRNLTKKEEPRELIEMRPFWERKVKEVGSDYYKTKYRSHSIKTILLKETYHKCIYCESKIGHNTPGDVEHKHPVSLDESKRFEWNNLTIACTECNRRKNDYLNAVLMFLDPYDDDVEGKILHFGPVVFAKPDEERAEISLRILELGELEKRPQLFAQKVTRLKQANNLMARIKKCHNSVLKNLLLQELSDMAKIDAEYSGMINVMINALPPNWAN
jgi:hypothetical protein